MAKDNKEKETKKPVARASASKKSPKFGGTGRRKTSTARVWISAQPGEATLTINGRSLEEYAGRRPKLRTMVNEPFIATGTQNRFSVQAIVSGGGIASQVGAVRHGLSRALIEADPTFRSVLAKAGLLTRDPREKERKKYGHKRARKSFQYSKR